MRSFAVTFSLLALVTTAFAAPAHSRDLCRNGKPISHKNIDCSAIVPRGEGWKGGDKYHSGHYDDDGYPGPYDYSDDDGDFDGDWSDGDDVDGYYGDEWSDSVDGEYYRGGHGGRRGSGQHDKDWGLEGDYYEHGWGDIPGLSSSQAGSGGSTAGLNNPSSISSPSNPQVSGNPSQGPSNPSQGSSNPPQGPSNPPPTPGNPPQANSNQPPPGPSPVPNGRNLGSLLDVTAALDVLPTMRPGPNGAQPRLPVIGIL